MDFGSDLNRFLGCLGDWSEEEIACLIGRGKQIFLNLSLKGGMGEILLSSLKI